VSVCHQHDGGAWESIMKMNLSNRSGRYSPELSSSDLHHICIPELATLSIIMVSSRSVLCAIALG